MPSRPDAVMPTDDAGLRKLVYEKENIVAIYTKQDCPVCTRLLQHMEVLSKQQKYKNTLFLVLDADQNPVSSRTVNDAGLPLVAVYRKCLLRKCDVLATEEELEDLLQELL